MKAQIFINLPVNNVDKSFEFYAQMGFINDSKFSDESAKCMVLSDDIFLMILSHDRFKTFVTKPISDISKTIPALYSLSLESLEKVNEMANNALEAGGKEPVEAKDYGFMQQRTIEDLDGHTWELFYMDESKFPQQ